MSTVTDTTNVKQSRAHLEDMSLKPARTIVFKTTKEPQCNKSVRDLISGTINAAMGAVPDARVMELYEEAKKQIRGNISHVAPLFIELGDIQERIDKVSLFINYGKKNAPHAHINVQCDEYCNKKLAKSARSVAKNAAKHENEEQKAFEAEMEKDKRYGGNKPFVPKEENWDDKAYDAHRKPGVIEVVPKGIPNMSALLSKFDKNIAEEARQSRMIALKKTPNAINSAVPIITAANYEEVKLECILNKLARGEGYCFERDEANLPTAAYERAMNASTAVTVVKETGVKVAPVVKANAFAIAFIANAKKEKAKKEAEKEAKNAEKKLKRDLEKVAKKEEKKARKEAEKAAKSMSVAPMTNVVQDKAVTAVKPATLAPETLESIKSTVQAALTIKSSVSDSPKSSVDVSGNEKSGDDKLSLWGSGPPPARERRYVAYERFINGILNDKT